MTASGIGMPDCKAETRLSIASGQARSRSLIFATSRFLFTINGIEVARIEIEREMGELFVSA
jgi:hypothetical protein